MSRSPPRTTRSGRGRVDDLVDVVSLPTADNVEGRIDVAAALGSSATAMYVYDLVPGQSSCPYHYEYEEEWLLVVAGEIVVRVPNGELSLSAGDLVRFPPGPDGAHKPMNRSEAPARIVMFSATRAPAVSVYPDSDKVGVFPGDGDLYFRRITAVEWGDGEQGWDRAT